MTDRDALLHDIELSRRIQVFCTWCGPAFVVLLFGGWGLMGGFIPLIPPSLDAGQVASAYGEIVNVHRIGALLGLKAADRASLDVVSVYGGGRWQQMLKVQIIAALPSTISGLKIAAPAALLGAIIGEYLGGVDSGLGVAITSAQQQYDVPRTWGLAFVCGAIAGLGYFLIGLVGRLLTPWATKSSLGGNS